jgi:hypothetical protein
MRRHASVAVLGMALASLAGCDKLGGAPADTGPPPPPPLYVTEFEVLDVTPPERRPVPLDGRAIDGMARKVLKEAGVRFLDTRTGAPAPKLPADAWRIDLRAGATYGVAEEDGFAREVRAGKVAGAWLVEAEIQAPGEPTPANEFFEIAEQADFRIEPGGPPEAATTALRAAQKTQLEAAAKTFANTMSSLTAALSGSPADLVGRLDHADPHVRRAIVGRLAGLRATDAATALAARLPKEDAEAVRLRIIGALGEIRDPVAIDALIAAADPKDRDALRAVVYALSAIGGDKVESFLDILGTHDSADVREMVEDARSRLKRGGGRGAVSPKAGSQPAPKPAAPPPPGGNGSPRKGTP